MGKSGGQHWFLVSINSEEKLGAKKH